MISNVEIKNITVFKNSITIDFCNGINVIIGENGSGKTHLLKLLYAECCNRHSFLTSIDFYQIFNIDKNIGFDDNMDGYYEVIGKCDKSVFIPAKEMLSHSKGLLAMAEKYSKDMPFDKTLLDILRKAQAWKPDDTPALAKFIVPKLEKVINGKVFMKDDNSFWVRKNDGLEIPFSMEAEGLRKFGLLWQLLMNESITKDTVLLWDEPESNLNPQLYSLLVDILLELSRNGVQIFLATHSYDLAKFADVKMQKDDDVLFHSLYKTADGVKCETAKSYGELENNAIEIGATELYNAVIAQDIEVLQDGQ